MTSLSLYEWTFYPKNGSTNFKNLAVWTPQDFNSMLGHFSTLCIGLTNISDKY